MTFFRFQEHSRNVNFIFSKFPNLQNRGHKSDLRRSITLDFLSQKDFIRVDLKSVSELMSTIREIFIRNELSEIKKKYLNLRFLEKTQCFAENIKF